jgi:Flp pilus assembly protein TadD
VSPANERGCGAHGSSPKARVSELITQGARLFEQGCTHEAVGCLREAAGLDRSSAPAHYNLGTALMALGDVAGACAAYRVALDTDPGFAAAHANLGLALLEAGEVDGAAQSLRQAIAIEPEARAARSGLAIALIRRGDLREALSVLEESLRRAPNATRDLSLKAVVLQRIGDREGARRLLDFDRLVVSAPVAAPAGFHDVAAFNAALEEHVLHHPSLIRSPARHATRGGRHSGDLLGCDAPVVAGLEHVIQEAVERYVARAGSPAAHPFLATAPERVVLTAWAVILDSGGYQIPHVHPAGWLSGVYYLRLPAADPLHGHAGWIEFGRPDPVIAGDGEPITHVLRPQPGWLVLFPSYVYHRTLPFEAPGPRISVAFDVMPDTHAPAA